MQTKRYTIIAAALLWAASLSAQPTLMWSMGWGRSGDRLGHRLADESAPEAPMSFDVDAKGRAWILDQVNRRVAVVRSGQIVNEIALPDNTYQDLSLAPDGSLWLLDRLASRRLDHFAADGRWLDSQAIEGAGIAEGGAVTALLIDARGVWLETEHRGLTRLAFLDGRVDLNRTRRLGRLRGDGKLRLLAARDGVQRVQIFARALDQDTAPNVLMTTLDLASRLLEVSALESDARGWTYLAAQTFEAQRSPPFDITGVDEQVWVLDREGRIVGSHSLRPRNSAFEQFRAYRLGDDAALYQLYCDADGVELWRVTP